MPSIDSLDVSVYTIPTEQPEADGTLEWDSTTMLVVEAHGGGATGLGYTYTQAGAADVVSGKLAEVVSGLNVLNVAAAWAKMLAAVRNFGQTGIAATAISAVDIALWDLKAHILDIPLVVAIDAVHETVPIYGSGGFCNYSDETLAEQLAGWAEAGIPRVKMKVGREPDRDEERLAAARKAIGDDVELFVDANGAYTRAQAMRWAEIYNQHDVRWLEEPLTSDDLEGLRVLRDRAPGGIDIAAGEYGWNPWYYEPLLRADAVDCVQVDVTRCLGITGFLAVAGMCDAFQLDVSAHCAPQITAQVCAAVRRLRHLEYFHDHVRIESMLFDGVLEPVDGALVPDRSRPGHGLELKRAEAKAWAA